jgi:hypothetical protein
LAACGPDGAAAWVVQSNDSARRTGSTMGLLILDPACDELGPARATPVNPGTKPRSAGMSGD